MIFENKVLGAGVVFIGFEVLARALTFLIIPILTNYFDRAEMGMYSTLLSINAFFGIFIGLSAHGAIEANFYQLSKEKIALYIGNIIIVLLLSFFLCCVLILLFGDLINQKFEIGYHWLIISLLIVFCQFITLINSTVWVMRVKSILYGLFQLSIAFLTLLLTSIFVIILDFDWTGPIIALLISSFLSSVVSIYLLISNKYVKVKLDNYFLKDFLSFGFPMIPHQLSNWIKGQGDRLLLISIAGAGATGLYSVGFQIGSIMGLLLMAANRAYYPYVFNKLSSGMTPMMLIKHVKLVYALMFSIILASLSFIVILDYIYHLIIGPEFLDSKIIAQLVIVAFIFDGFYYLFVCVLFYFKKTATLAKITFPLSIFHIVITYFMIKNFSSIGVAYALIITYFLQFVAVWFYSNRIFKMPWRLGY